MNVTIPKHYIAQFISSNPIILEAGAHIGRDTVKMAKLWPHAQIYAFEPVPELYEQLKINTAQFSNVATFNMALAQKSGNAIFYKSSGRSTATSSLLAPQEYLNEMPGTFFEHIEVPTIDLDSWASVNNVTKIDLMWLDMQGGELDALKGAQKLIPTVTAIYTEVNFVERYKGNPLYTQIKQWLYEHGFVPHQEAVGHKTWANVLFLRK